jgi:hypothetical protein
MDAIFRLYIRKAAELNQNPVQTKMKIYTVATLICFSLYAPSTFGQQSAVSPATKLSPAAIASINKGIVAAKLPDYLLAIRCFEAARAAAPQSPQIFFYLGLAESKVPGRELRAICWFGAYLAASPAAANAAAVQEQIHVLYMQSQSNLARLVQTAQKTAVIVQFPNPWLKILAQAEITKDEAATGDIAGAKKAFSIEIKSAGSIENEFGKSFALQGIADAQAQAAVAQREAGDINAAQKTFASALATADLINHDDDKSWAQMRIVQNQVDAGDLETAIQTAALISDATPRTYAWAAIAKGQLYNGDIAGAQKTAALTEDISDYKSIIETDVARAQAQAGNISEALKITGSIQNPYYRGSAQLSVARLQVKADDIQGAQETLESARKNADMIQIAADKDKLQGPLSETEAKVAKIVSTQRDMDKFGKVERQIKDGDITNALKNIDLFENPEFKAEGLAFVAETQAKNGEVTGANGTVALVTNESWKANLLNGIAAVSEMARNGITGDQFNQYLEGQKSILQQEIAGYYLDAGDISGAKRIVELINDAFTKINVLSSIAEAGVMDDDAAGAQSALTYALKTASLIKDVTGKSSAQQGIAYYQAKEGDIAGAQKTVDLIGDPYYKSGAQKYVAAAQAKTGDAAGAQNTLAEAQKTVDLIQDANLKSQAQNDITKALVEAGIGQTAVRLSNNHSGWLDKLDDSEKANYCPLNTELFLDFAAYLGSQNSNDPEILFNTLKETAEKIVKAQNIVGQMLKQQGLQKAGE